MSQPVLWPLTVPALICLGLADFGSLANSVQCLPAMGCFKSAFKWTVETASAITDSGKHVASLCQPSIRCHACIVSVSYWHIIKLYLYKLLN